VDTVHEQIWTLADRVAHEVGCEVIEVELVGASPRQVLRVYLDRLDSGEPNERSRPEGVDSAESAAVADAPGVGVGDCATVSRRLGDVLEAHEALLGSYLLEVSSPGLNRPLRRPEHFLRYVGERVKVRTVEASNGQRNYAGVLAEVGEDAVVIQCNERRVSLPLSTIDKARLDSDIDLGRSGRRNSPLDRRRKRAGRE